MVGSSKESGKTGSSPHLYELSENAQNLVFELANGALEGIRFGREDLEKIVKERRLESEGKLINTHLENLGFLKKREDKAET